MFGNAFLHVAVQSKHLEVRKASVIALEKEHGRSPREMHEVLRTAISAFLDRHVNKSIETSADDEEKQGQKRNLVPILSACAVFTDDADLSMKEKLLADLLIPAHRSDICGHFFPWRDVTFLTHPLLQTMGRGSYGLTCVNGQELILVNLLNTRRNWLHLVY